MADRYDHLKLEPYWHNEWEKANLYKTQEPEKNQDTYYALSMFPYPSGTLHMGHVRNYVITDVLARQQRMLGKAVLHPMGWDAFGLPAENAAIERGIEPSDWTKKNIKHMKDQLKRLGLSVDWDKEINTSESNYYKWTQFIFLKLYSAGLAYQKEATVNWDPIDQTVLANEQVDSDGKSWRSGAIVEKKNLKQWFLSITKYGEVLLNDIEKLSGWPDRVKMMQSNWIGKSEGSEIRFYLERSRENFIDVFTTRADTLYGVTYLVVSPEYADIDLLITEENKKEFKKFKDSFKKLSENEVNSDNRTKNGMFLGSYVRHPCNDELIPIWTGDYVLANYGTGAVMGVPGHDSRDYNFAKKYNLEVKYVISDNKNKVDLNKAYTNDGILINSDFFDNYNSTDAKSKIIQYGIENGWAKVKTQYKLRDWLISRQRYWGCPIPIIKCDNCGNVPVPLNQLPVKLPTKVELTGKGNSPLNNLDSWSTVDCPKCGKKSTRETDTMDTFMCSSWYYLRYVDANNDNCIFSKDDINKWLPVNQYVGGIEHAILHLLYSRFIIKALQSANLIDISEPFDNLLTQGMVQSLTYKNVNTNKYVPTINIRDPKDPIDPEDGNKLQVIYEKMSKSKYNGVDPSNVINKYGADTARMFILFKAPPEKDLEWDDSDVEGQYKFLQRIYKQINSYFNSKVDKYSDSIKSKSFPKTLNSYERNLRKSVHKAIKNITEDIKLIKLNTSISELMILSNSLSNNIEYVCEPIAFEAISSLILLLSPFAPHLSEELWVKHISATSVHLQKWPMAQLDLLNEETYELVIQINGKVRGRTNVDHKLTKSDLERIVLDNDITKKWLNGIKPKRLIVIPGKLVNVVI